MNIGWFAIALFFASSVADEELPWWMTTTFYEVYPRSFKDSDGDGIGDLKGIIEKADHFKDIGVDAIWMTPIFPSPMVDIGYDISDFTDIDPTYGTLEDFDALLEKCKQLGVKVLLDFVPNHTSDKHPWFQASTDPTHPLHQDYKDFYVWLDSKGTTSDGKPIPPNNWVSVFGGPAWRWSDLRKQFYLHHFTKEQPDLNYRNPNVVSNMSGVLDFWTERGVDGFRVDAVDHIFEDAEFPDEQPWSPVVGTPTEWGQMRHTAMLNQPETFKLLDDWADFLYMRGLEKSKQLVMFMEVYASLDISMKYYGTGKRKLKIPFNFLLYLDGGRFVQPWNLKRIIDMWMNSKPADAVPNWVISNHDVMRIPDRYGPEMLDTMNMLTAVLPGVKVAYYGDEIGMENTDVTSNETIANSSSSYSFLHTFRDQSRTPMQWDDTPNAGFSTNNNPWLPVNPKYWQVNVKAQKEAPISHLKVFQAMAEARKDPVLQRGDLKVIVPDTKTLLVTRSYNGSRFIFITNLGISTIDYTKSLTSMLGLDVNMTVVVGSVNSGYFPGDNFRKESKTFSLRPKAAVLLRSGSSQVFYSAVFIVMCLFISTLT